MKLNTSFRILSILIAFVQLTPIHYAQQPSISDSLKSSLPNNISDTLQIIELNQTGGNLVLTGNYDLALEYLTSSAELAKETEYYDGLAVALNAIGVIYMNKSQYNLSISYYQKALEVRKRMHDLKGCADIISNIGIVYSNKGSYAPSLHYNLISLKIREAIHDHHGIAISMIQIANLYLLQAKYAEALRLNLQLLKMAEIKDDLYSKAVVSNNVGILYIELGNYKEAYKYFSTELEIDQHIGDQEGIANSYCNIGEVLSKMGNFTQALNSFVKGQEIFKKIGSKRGLCNTYQYMGEAYTLLGQNKKAIECYNLELQVATEIASKINLSTAHSKLSALYKKDNNYKKAYEHYELFKQIENDIHDELTKRAIGEMEIKYNTQKKETEISNLVNDKYYQEIKHYNQLIISYGLIALSIISSLIIFFLFNRRRIKRKNQLERKNFEIQLKALSEQMNPHFIFNSLNSIMEFIRIAEKDAALKYLTKFSRLIRLVLETSGKKSITLLQEIELLKLYMDLENLRFGNIFTYHMDIDKSIDLYNTEIPPLIIQPFIENAILHGIQNQAKMNKNYHGVLEIQLQLKEEFLLCLIRDNGIGREKAMIIKQKKLIKHQSLGMRITNDRLGLLSENKCKIELIDMLTENGTSQGTEVKILIPLTDPL